jgi:hypothetical protein
VSLDNVRAIANTVGVATLFERVSSPSAQLTDFFGIQVLRPVRPAEVLADFVPRHATLLSRDAHAMTLELNGGPRVEFRFASLLVVNGNPVDVPYARVLLQDPASYPAEAVLFRQQLERSGLARKYLEPNAHYNAERIAYARMRTAASIDSVVPAADTSGYGALTHAVIVVGETHGGTGPYELARQLLGSTSVQWIGIEMLPEDLQPTVDRYIAAASGSPAYHQSREKLLQYYAANWNTRGHEVTADPAGNPYFRLIELARSLHKRVYALDANPLFILFRFGEFPLGATTRDYVWAANIPDTGRGVVYGGSSHFLASRRPNTLTFLRERDARVAIFSLTAR